VNVRSPLCLLLLVAGCGESAPGNTPTRQSARCTAERTLEQFSYSEGNPAKPEFFVQRTEFRRTDNEGISITWGQGPDGKWLTADDVVYDYSRSVRSGTLLEHFTYKEPGPDGQWLTADDAPSAHEFFCSPAGPGGRALGSLYLNSAGADGKPCTDDDEVYDGTAYQYDASGLVVKTISSDDPGADKKWLTADDRITAWYTTELESDGAPKTVKLAMEPGADGKWLTADDPVKVYATFSYKGNDESDQHMGDGGIYRYCVTPKF